MGEKVEKVWDSDYEAVPKYLVDQSWNALEGRIRSRSRRLYRRRILGMAACMAALLFSGYYFFEIYNPTITIGNFTAIGKEVSLPDGSIVLLSPGSEIRYKKSFEKSRGAELDGEAFFDIARDSTKEFTVETDFTTTRVLGTTFLVTETPDLKNTEVKLYTGKISMSVNHDSATSWEVFPGESFVYENGRASVEKFEKNSFWEAENQFSDFNEVPLEELFEYLEERFNCRFVRNEYTKNNRVTMRINTSDSLPQILHLLSIINQTKYEINKTTNEVYVSKK